MSKKLPKPGEWWANDAGDIAYIAGSDPEGDPVFISGRGAMSDIDAMDNFLLDWHHEPDCTGYDWVKPPVKWYKYNFVSDHTFRVDGSTYELFTKHVYRGKGTWNDECKANGLNGTLVEINEVEGLARIKAPPQNIPVRLWLLEFDGGVVGTRELDAVVEDADELFVDANGQIYLKGTGW